jgi:hypothetical protein
MERLMKAKSFIGDGVGSIRLDWGIGALVAGWFLFECLLCFTLVGPAGGRALAAGAAAGRNSLDFLRVFL